MAVFHPHIHFNGNAEEAFGFYQTVFGGNFSRLLRYRDLSTSAFPFPDKEGNKIMFIALSVGNDTQLKGSDVLEAMGRVEEIDNRTSISIQAASREEADKIFKGLSAGGDITMPLSDGPYGSYFGMFTDKFGIQWMIDHPTGN